MDKMKFNYQVVFKLNDNDRVIFAGVTDLLITELFEYCKSRLVIQPLEVVDVESFIYQPINSNENGSQESTR